MSSYQWKKENRDNIFLRIPKGNREKLKQLANSQGKENVARLIKDALYHYMDDIGVERINLE
jgi:predicted DNA-binding protein